MRSVWEEKKGRHMEKPTIITFSGQARHGKDTAVQILKGILISQGKKPLAINYTDYLKFVAAQYLGWDGNKDENGRSFLQMLGTEKVNPVNPSFWVDTVIRTVDIIGSGFDFVLIGDCRFIHDITRWTEEGYRILPFHVTRLNFENELSEAQRNHATEVSLNGYRFTGYLSANDIPELENEVAAQVVPLLNL